MTGRDAEAPAFRQTAFSARQVAARWGVSSRHIYDLCARCKLGHLRIGGLIRIRLEDLEAYEAQQWQAPTLNAAMNGSSDEGNPRSGTVPSGGRSGLDNAFQRGRQSAARLRQQGSHRSKN